MPTDRQALARALRHLRGAPVEHNRHALALQGVVDAARAMFEADGAALLLPGGDELVCVAATDDAMRAVEEAQITSGQGPCRDAIASGAVVAASDITRAGAWPELAAKAGSFPIRSMLSAPVGFAGRVVGSLCVSARVVRRWSQADRATVTAYASVVGDLLEAEIGLEQVAETVEQLEHALVSRVLIEQAKGVLMARYGLDPGAAFQDMRRRARSELRKALQRRGDL